MMFTPWTLLVLGGSIATALVPTTWNDTSYNCKCYLGDSCWPSPKQWAALNASVDGNLLVDIPPGAVCHTTFQGPLGTIPTYNAAACANVSTLTEFYSEQWTTDQPAAELWTYYTNETCRPTTVPSDPCTLGYYGVYVLTAQTHAHLQAGLDFARTHDLRLVVRNTGHDFLGRSTGWGALVLNTHHFQDVEFVDAWDGPGEYTGPAVTVGAGVQGRALLREANKQDPPLAVVVGECPTVGTSGGFIQGGGHGPLTTIYGLAVDNVLEFQVLTAAGEYKTANPATNSDLFWALRGGGPSAYALILSTTFRVHADMPSAGAILNINATHTGGNDTLLWEAMSVFHSLANHLVDAGLYVYWEMQAGSLHVQPFVGFGMDVAQLGSVLAPLWEGLDAVGLPGNYSAVVKGFDTLFDLYIDLFEDETAGVTALTGGWMFAHEDVATNNDGILAAFQNAITKGGFMVGHLWDPGHGVPVSTASVNPRFRNATDFVIVGIGMTTNATLAEKAAAQELLTYDLDQKFREAGPNGCGYVNEGDPYQPDWQTHFYGTSYPRLLELRKKWDPEGVFYSIATPGTEDWEVIEYGTKLCKKL